MPEVMRGATRSVLADHSGSGSGFFIRTVASPEAVVVKGGVKPLARRALTPSGNKENVPPTGAVRAAPKRRSPLPDWYPRTPLRDITSIVKALEKRRSQLEDAAAQQQIQWTEDPTTPIQEEQSAPQSIPQLEDAAAQQQTQWTEDPTTPVPEEQSAPQSIPQLEDAAAQQQTQWTEDPTTPVQGEQSAPQSIQQTQEILAVVASSLVSTQVVANPTTSFAEDKIKASSSPSDRSFQTAPLKPNDPALADLEKELSSSIEQIEKIDPALADLEKELSSSIEQIEKIVCQNLKKAPKATQPSKMTIQRRTLMSMR